MRYVAQVALALLMNTAVLSADVTAAPPQDFLRHFTMTSDALARTVNLHLRRMNADGINHPHHDSLPGALTLPARVASRPTPPPPPTPAVVRIEPPRRVLFIGNSFTYYNKGIDHHLRQLAGSASPPVELDVNSQTASSQNLRGHYLNRTVQGTIRTPGFLPAASKSYIPEITRFRLIDFEGLTSSVMGRPNFPS
jgi:hypothetical protein